MWSLLHSAVHKQEKRGYRLQGLMVAQTSQLSRQRRFVVQLGRTSGRSSLAERELPNLPLVNPNTPIRRPLAETKLHEKAGELAICRSSPRISRTHERGDRSTSRFDYGRCQSTGFSCQTLAPGSTGTKTQGDRKWLSD